MHLSEDSPSPDASKTEATDQSSSGWFNRLAGLTQGDQFVVVSICVLLLGWSAYRWVDLSQWGAREIEIARQQPLSAKYVLDVNEATWIELALLDGVGEVLGKRIVTYRQENGPFTSLDDLRAIKGIGKITLDKMRPNLRVEHRQLGLE